MLILIENHRDRHLIRSMIGETTPSDGDSGIGIKRENLKGASRR